MYELDKDFMIWFFLAWPGSRGPEFRVFSVQKWLCATKQICLEINMWSGSLDSRNSWQFQLIFTSHPLRWDRQGVAGCTRRIKTFFIVVRTTYLLKLNTLLTIFQTNNGFLFFAVDKCKYFSLVTKILS